VSIPGMAQNSCAVIVSVRRKRTIHINENRFIRQKYKISDDKPKSTALFSSIDSLLHFSSFFEEKHKKEKHVPRYDTGFT
jgi:hypothetical protein